MNRGKLVPYLRTMLAALTFLLVFAFPAWGQATTGTSTTGTTGTTTGTTGTTTGTTGTTTGTTTAPIAESGGCRVVDTFTGSGETRTDTPFFTIVGPQWRVAYETKNIAPPPVGMLFAFFIRNERGQALDPNGVKIESDQSGIKNVVSDPGRYYIQIISSQVDWTLRVEDCANTTTGTTGTTTGTSTTGTTTTTTGTTTGNVTICHNGTETIVVDPSARVTHLAHGDTLGACGQTTDTTTTTRTARTTGTTTGVDTTTTTGGGGNQEKVCVLHRNKGDDHNNGEHNDNDDNGHANKNKKHHTDKVVKDKFCKNNRGEHNNNVNNAHPTKNIGNEHNNAEHKDNDDNAHANKNIGNGDSTPSKQGVIRETIPQNSVLPNTGGLSMLMSVGSLLALIITGSAIGLFSVRRR